MKSPQSILREVFGYQEFRPLQLEVINDILHKKDAAVIMPTGGGKSICYQIPALLFKGVTVVISPLISLMKDQVDQLSALGIPAVMLNSSLSVSEYNANTNSILSGDVKLIYLSPEALFSERIQELLKKVQVECFTIDEAHCISEWGHDFRKEYRQIGLLRNEFPHSVFTALTATATPRVKTDIVKNLNLVNPSVYVASFDRDNLYLSVQLKTFPDLQSLDFIRAHPKQSGIIYCFSRKQVDELTEFLQFKGISALPYHAGLTDSERSKNQELFLRDEVDIIVATIAFGMGINKSNVRFVIHHDLPKNIESYYQEIGRAGRDGLRANTLLLYDPQDAAKIGFFIKQKDSAEERKVAYAHLDAIEKYASQSRECRRKPLIKYFGETYEKHNCGMCDVCTQQVGVASDVTTAAQKFLSAVKRTDEQFTVGHIVEVLWGIENPTIIKHQHHKLSVYGIGKEYKKEVWYSLAKQFEDLGIISIQGKTVSLTPSSRSVLFDGQKINAVLNAPREQEKYAARDLSGIRVFNERLFMLLRVKRKEIADDEGVPAYVIFSDATVTDMATKQPTTIQDLGRISGVGSMKLKRYGNAFVREIQMFKKENGRGFLSPPSQKKSFAEEVAEVYESGISITSLTSLHRCSIEKIVDNLLEYIKTVGLIREDGFEELNTLNRIEQNKISELFKQNPNFTADKIKVAVPFKTTTLQIKINLALIHLKAKG